MKCYPYFQLKMILQIILIIFQLFINYDLDTINQQVQKVGQPCNFDCTDRCGTCMGNNEEEDEKIDMTDDEIAMEAQERRNLVRLQVGMQNHALRVSSGMD